MLDGGPGIDAPQRERIFSRFERLVGGGPSRGRVHLPLQDDNTRDQTT